MNGSVFFNSLLLLAGTFAPTQKCQLPLPQSPASSSSAAPIRVYSQGILEPSKQRFITRLDGSKITSGEVDRAMNELMNNDQVTGAAIAIFNRGHVAFLKAYGQRDKRKNLPLTMDSVMSVASLSKAAFAVMVMRLVERHVLNLDRPVYQYLPKPLASYEEYSDLAGDERYKQITARMLLSHTSGFANFRGSEGGGKLKIHFDPGSKFAYSGEGINLLQFVVEHITNRPLEQLMQEQVFVPLKMTRTSMIWQDRFENNYAVNYDESGQPMAPPKWHHGIAAGSMLTTPQDLSKFFEGVMGNHLLGKKEHDEVFKAQIKITSKHEFPTLDDETTNENEAIQLSYGLGWGLYWSPYGEAFFKEGYNDGWRDYAVCFNGPKSGVIILTNSANGDRMYRQILERLLANNFTPLEWERFPQ